MRKTLLFIAMMGIVSFTFAQDIFNASRTNNKAEVEKYIAAGVSVDTTNSRGFTPLILAIYNDSFEAASYLIEKGANVNAQDMSGNTALMGATFKAYPRMVDLLLNAKANVNQKNLNEATALIFAATFGQQEIAKKLLAKGADKSIQDKSGKTALDHATLQDNTAMIDLLK